MEIADVRKRVLETIDRARRTAAGRRTRADQAARDYDLFLERIATPLFRQVANALRAEGYTWSVSTPSGSVRLASDRSGEDYIALTLETAGPAPEVVGHTSRARGHRVIETEQPIGRGESIPELTEQAVLDFLMKELEPFVER
ncbi:MAG: hypothetical protein ACM3SQ_04500 [Betaproteobacteria bacterium]